jgi:hypothetical protein
MADISSNLPVRAAVGDVVVNVLGGSTGGVIINPASEGTLGNVLAGVTGIAASDVAILAGVTALGASSTAILAGVTGIAAQNVNILAGITNIAASNISILAGVTGIAATDIAILAGVTAIKALDTSILAGVTAGNATAVSILAGVTGISAKLPAVLGNTGAAQSLSVTIASDQSSIPVYITAGANSTPVVQFDTAASVAFSAGLTGTYEPANAFVLNNVHASGSGRIKVEVYVGLIAGWDATRRKWVAFNSTANPNVDINCSDYKLAATVSRVQVVVTNIESGKAQDLYSTIVGDLS